MRLEQLTVALRPRNRWEAMDLGIALARRHYLDLWRLWWISASPLALLVVLLLHAHPAWIGPAIWWFKPAFEPLMMFWLGRVVFNERLPLGRASRHWWEASRRRLPANLLWRRFSPARSFLMAVTVLEQPDAATWRARTRVLTRGFSAGQWLTLLCVNFEGILALGLVLGALSLLPTQLLPHWRWPEWIAATPALIPLAWTCAGVLAMSLIAPFYVAGGFALYLSRRTDLEAWDIELDFRRLARRIAAGVVPLLLLVMPLFPPPVAAADLRAHTQQVIDQVLAAPEFGHDRQVTGWRLKNWKWRWDWDRSQSRSSLADFATLARVAEYLLWLTLVVLLAWLLLQWYRRRDQLRPRRVTVPPERHAGKAAASPLNHPADRPEDLSGEVHGRLRAGRIRDALSLLYRASLASLAPRLEVADSATEAACLARISATLPEGEASYFRDLTHAWIGLAYAGRDLPDTVVFGLLERWQRLYGSKDASR